MRKARKEKNALLAAAFIMATSAIGPGFLTQTVQFSAEYLTSLGFVIVCVIIMDFIVQLNIWSVIGSTGLHGQEIANQVLPGLGTLLIFFISLGGLSFNIGNISGTALGLGTLFGLNEKIGAMLGGGFAICIFLSKNGKTIINRIAQIFSVVILITIFIICITSNPPVSKVMTGIFTTENPVKLVIPMLTLLGGSCGGYICFSGAHRLLDSGFGGKADDAKIFRKSSILGICVSGTTRIILFLAVLGVCYSGGVAITQNTQAITSAANPAAEFFRLAAGTLGYRLFGLILFGASITSVLGAAYTSVSFLKTLHPLIQKYERFVTCGFIFASTLLLMLFGSAKRMILLAGAVNGFVLSISLCCILLACGNKRIVGNEYQHPLPLRISGWIVVAFAVALAFITVKNLFVS